MLSNAQLLIRKISDNFNFASVLMFNYSILSLYSSMLNFMYAMKVQKFYDNTFSDELFLIF